jgi:hypothetical protein
VSVSPETDTDEEPGPRDRLEAAGRALFGYHWKRAIARLLKVDPRLVRRWANDEREIPPWALEKVEEALSAVKQPPGKRAP